MKRSAIIVAALLLVLLGVIGWYALSTRVTVSDAKSRLQLTLAGVPMPAGSVVLSERASVTSGAAGACAWQEIELALGTNDLLFGEVLDYYTQVLEAHGWRAIHSTEQGRGFMLGDWEYGLEIASQSETQTLYRTVYRLNAATPLRIPLPQRCRGG